MADDLDKPPRKRSPRKAAKKAVKKAPTKKAAPKKAPAKKAAKKRTAHLHAVPDSTAAETPPAAESTTEPESAIALGAESEPPDPYALPEVFDPPYEAHRLRLSGMPWREVARRTGYASEQNACTAVQTYLQKAALARSAEAQQQALQTQIERYEALIHSYWIKATVDHDKDAAAVILRAMTQLDRVQRFGESDLRIQGRTIVISGTREEYIAQLQAVVEGRLDELEDGHE